MKRVTGLGGVFFKAADKKGMLEWYRAHLGIESAEYGFSFLWRENDSPERVGYTVWSPFKRDTEYFEPSKKDFMLNFRVADLSALIPALKAEGVQVVGEIVEEENGKFAWIVDPEGNKIELWEPVDPNKDPYLPK
jgi:predicted enzyme related to lactoylglutathione lyase